MTVQANENVATGYLVGTGAALNVSLGWIPRIVRVINLTDGDVENVGILDKMIAFTSGGTNTPVAGNTITGITSGATAKIKQVVLLSGTYAAGNAVGFFICDVEDVVGTFQSENVTLNTSAAATDDATVVAQVELGIAITTAAASVTGNSGITSYAGSSTAGKGFTLGSTVSESAKLLHYIAYR
jgi:hypothetical protein